VISLILALPHFRDTLNSKLPTPERRRLEVHAAGSCRPSAEFAIRIWMMKENDVLRVKRPEQDILLIQTACAD
jgi:hypothetical protein